MRKTVPYRRVAIPARERKVLQPEVPTGPGNARMSPLPPRVRTETVSTPWRLPGEILLQGVPVRRRSREAAPPAGPGEVGMPCLFDLRQRVQHHPLTSDEGGIRIILLQGVQRQGPAGPPRSCTPSMGRAGDADLSGLRKALPGQTRPGQRVLQPGMLGAGSGGEHRPEQPSMDRARETSL